MAQQSSEPTIKLADYGRYGLHVMQYPSGRYGYVGTVPMDLHALRFATQAEAIAAYDAWLQNR